jgi:hypothetical protein
MSQPSDSHLYRNLLVTPDLMRLFVNALHFYANALEQDIAAFRLDEELAKLLDERTLRSFQISRAIEYSREIAGRIEKLVPDTESVGASDMPMTHGLVRQLKAVCLLYIGELEKRRNAIATERASTIRSLEVIDTKLLELREAMEKGVFGRAEPVPLLIAPDAAERPLQTSQAVTITRSDGVVTIEIVDQELRERCLDMFNEFDESNQPHRFDTIIMEATRILENRVRTTAGLGPESTGLELMAAAFGGKTPKLRVSGHAPEQEGAHHLFRGIIGFVRNPVHHRLTAIQKVRAVQVMGFIDYLLYLTETAESATA